MGGGDCSIDSNDESTCPFSLDQLEHSLTRFHAVQTQILLTHPSPQSNDRNSKRRAGAWGQCSDWSLRGIWRRSVNAFDFTGDVELERNPHVRRVEPVSTTLQRRYVTSVCSSSSHYSYSILTPTVCFQIFPAYLAVSVKRGPSLTNVIIEGF